MKPSLEPARSKAETYILWFNEIRKDDVAIVGGKCAHLGELSTIGMPVPPGFSISSLAYKEFLNSSGLQQKIQSTLNEEVKDPKDPAQCEEASRIIRRLIEGAAIPSIIQSDIRSAYERLCGHSGVPNVAVAVRSSATAEDLPDASFAGQQESFLNVSSPEELVGCVTLCWASLYTPRAIFYRAEKGFTQEVSMSVIVQQMVPADVSGVIFTINPTTGDRSQMIIESAWGLGECVVSGLVTPDHFVLDKTSGSLLRKEVSKKEIQCVADPDKGRTVKVPVPPAKQEAPSLNEFELSTLFQLARNIEAHYGRPQDIEFAVRHEKEGSRSYILQARPETVWTGKMPHPTQRIDVDRQVVVKGLPASPGSHLGLAKVCFTTQDASRLMRNGDILVTRMTNPDWVPYMRLAGAIVCDDGGVTAHAAIVSREMGLPCIVGAREATRLLKTGGEYTVDAKAGVVYAGVVEDVLKPVTPVTAQSPQAVAGVVTSTKVYVNLSIPEIADKICRETQADGVGLLRAEHMMLSVGKHPRLLIEEGGAEKMINAFAEGIRRVAEPFYPRPVVYRFLDFKPDEFLGLPGGEKYEKEAGHVGPNPLLGYRGGFRYVKEPDVFRLECRAIRKVREEYRLNNVWVMVPFLRTLGEFRNAERIMEEEGLRRGSDLKLWIMCEVPATVFLIDKFLDEGIDGISFGTNDLTMLILGIDRDDASVQEIYDERNPAVLRAISHVIRISNEHKVTTSICGQAPSNYPEVVEFLVREGATSLSVNPDKVIETKMLVAGIEQKLILEGLRDVHRRNQADKDFKPYWSH